MVRDAWCGLDPDGGQIEFGAVQIALECWSGQAGARLNVHGSDAGTEVSGDGDGDGQIEEDGTLQGETRSHNGDDTPFTA